MQPHYAEKQCDNMRVVAAVNKGSAKEDQVMQLLHILCFFVAHFDLSITVEHIAGSQNLVANQLSHNNNNPQAKTLPTPLSAELLDTVTLRPDWTSIEFTQRFTAILSKV